MEMAGVSKIEIALLTLTGQPLDDHRRPKSCPNLFKDRWKAGDLTMSDNTISILDGSTFLVCSPNGDIDAGPDKPDGLFFKDMRHLSKWKLTMKGTPLDVLSTDAIEYYFSQHFCVPPTGTIYKNPNIS